MATGLTVLAAAGLLLCAGQPWVGLRAEDATAALAGGELTGGLTQALGVVAGAGALLGLTLRARGRQLLAVLLLAVGAGAVWVGLRPPEPSEQAARAALSRVSLSDVFQTGTTAWPWLYALAGALLAAGAVLTLLRAGRWTPAADRYRREASGTNRYRRGRTPVDPDDPSSVWRALDAGEDPTAGAPPGTRTADPSGEPPENGVTEYPISPAGHPGDRMRPTPDSEGRS